MSDNIFFKKKGPFGLNTFFSSIKNNIKIYDVKPLSKASKKDITFYDSAKYKVEAQKTEALACITNEKLKNDLPSKCIIIISKKILYDLSQVTKKFYPEAHIDFPDFSLKLAKKSKFHRVKFGNNVLIGNSVKIGHNSEIGSNTVIEKNVIIGKRVIIGSNVHIKNCMIGDDVVIQSGCKIGCKGFGFIPIKRQNLKFPHIGKVVIENNVEIANNCTIDRGSIDDTKIGENTYLDNQVHVAHNVKIGKNCMIAGQVGFAGSTTIGDNVSIGGQAGVSGHLKIGNNVKIGGGSGVIRDIADNEIVMGYPAIPFKEFVKSWKK
jgi:UDP-3-O-[3-hydroxymyristoyl] glucosamine N-acyltransferase